MADNAPYSKFIRIKQTPQTERIPGERGKRQVKNRAGGYVFQTDDWGRLDRFLILGSDSPTYYATSQELTAENAQSVINCINEDGVRVVDTIINVSQSGRAPRNSPALFALALTISLGDLKTRRAASEALLGVARTASHLFEWISYVRDMRGFGRVVKTAVEHWYNSRGSDTVAYQMLKYKNRYGWTHEDVIKMTRPNPITDAHSELFAWAIGKADAPDGLPSVVEQLHDPNEPEYNTPYLQSLIREHNLSREMLPTHYLNDPGTWEALLENMPVWALVRNLGKMTSIGLLSPGSDATYRVVKYLSDRNYLSRGRMHPLAILQAMSVYRSGGGLRGSLSWNPNARVLDALDDAFYLTFGNIEPIGNRVLIGLDVSGSMSMGSIAGMQPVTPREGAAAMSLITRRTEDWCEIVAFQRQLVPFQISDRQRLDDVINATRGLPFGPTDCARPMIYALENGMSVDTFIILTDNETWAGRQMHPVQALDTYRNKTGINAKLAVVGMTSNGFSIADPNDPGMMDFVGFDTAAPNLLADFARS